MRDHPDLLHDSVIFFGKLKDKWKFAIIQTYDFSSKKHPPELDQDTQDDLVFFVCKKTVIDMQKQ